MSKFAPKKQVADTTNYMGEKAFKRSAKIELVNAVLTSFIESTYYEKADKRITRISELVEEVAKKDPEFVAKLAIFARDSFNMRSSSHVILGELAKVHRGDNLVGRAIYKAAIRPDDLIEIVSYVDKPLRSQVKRGVARAFEKFDEYQLAKYRSTKHTMKLVDVVNLVHPKHSEAIKKLVHDELRSTETWESKVSAAKGDTEKVKESWHELFDTNRASYMAVLRNLRNIAQTGDGKLIKKAADFISDPERVRKSRQFPFRFLSAYESLGSSDKRSSISFEKDKDSTAVLKDAVEAALNVSIKNLPLYEGKTAILADNSGSMGGDYGGSGAISANSSRTSASIANLFATMYWMKANNTFVGLFGDQLLQPKLDRSKGLFDNYNIVAKKAEHVGGGTEQGIFDFFKNALEEKVKVDRVFIFSDMQIGRNSWYGIGYQRNFNQLFQDYKKFNPDVKVYSVDLRGYGTTVFSDGIAEFSGFSDKLFEIVALAEQDRNALIKKIEEVEI